MTGRSVTAPRIATLVAGLFVFGIEGARPDPPSAPGESLYRRYCAACHGVSARLRSGIPDLMRQIDLIGDPYGRRTALHELQTLAYYVHRPQRTEPKK